MISEKWRTAAAAKRVFSSAVAGKFSWNWRWGMQPRSTGWRVGACARHGTRAGSRAVVRRAAAGAGGGMGMPYPAGMSRIEIAPWRHSHAYAAEHPERTERRTQWVVAITLATMAVEIAAGTAFRSMALLADGWHMGTHAAALGVAAFAYRYARRHAADPRYSFGTGKVGALGGFASAVGLAVVALLVGAESATRLAQPVGIRFDQAIGIAVLGLAVNLGCAWLLHAHEPHHHHDHDHQHAGD